MNREDFIKMDRTAFGAGSHEETEARKMAEWASWSPEQRVLAAAYLNSVAFDYDIENPPKVDRTVFSTRKHAC